MTPFQLQLFIAVAAIVAAFVAGAFSFLNLVISKEQKVSEFRQEWIDAFRREVSELAAAIHHINYYLGAHDFDVHGTSPTPVTQRAVASELRESYEAFGNTFTSLILRINGEEKKPNIAKLNDEFLAALWELRDAFNEKQYDKATKLVPTLRERAIPILKHEWERVKQGEQVYRWSKSVAAVLLVLAALGIGVLTMWPTNGVKKPDNRESTTTRPTPTPTSAPAATPALPPSPTSIPSPIILNVYPCCPTPSPTVADCPGCRYKSRHKR
jgi:hypothetical protein